VHRSGIREFVELVMIELQRRSFAKKDIAAGCCATINLNSQAFKDASMRARHEK